MSESISPLISAQKLAQIIDDPTVCLLDASIAFQIPTETEKDHTNLIPNSIRFDYDHDFCDPDDPLPHMMPSEARFTALAQQLGINQDSQIVVYDNSGTFASPRAWWMFKAMGHQQVFVLDGGLTAWKQAGFATVTEYKKAKSQGDFCAKLDKRYFVDAQFMLAQIDNDQHLTVDARSLARFYAKAPEPREGMRSGHIPNAVCVPFASLMDGHKLKDKAQLAEILDAQLKPEKQAYSFSCGSGVTACIVLLAAYICGYQNLSVYDGSWTQWGADHNLPIAID